MTWTKDKPTVPGWYWWRQQPTDFECEIVRVQKDVEVGLIAMNQEFYDLVENMPGEWAGPLEQPA